MGFQIEHLSVRRVSQKYGQPIIWVGTDPDCRETGRNFPFLDVPTVGCGGMLPGVSSTLHFGLQQLVCGKVSDKAMGVTHSGC